MINKKIFTFLILFCTIPVLNSWAYWVWSPEEGKFINPEGSAEAGSAQEQYDYAMGFYKEKNLDEAVKQFEILLKKSPASKVAAEAQYRVGTIYEEKGDYLKAYQAYKTLVESYPQSDRFKEVIEREFRVGNLFLSGKKGKFMGLEILPSLPKAVEVFTHITKHAPYSDYGDQAQFQLGIAYKRQGRFGDAVEAFQGLIDQYPQSELVSKARFELAEVSYQRSAAQFRDQRALEDASKQVDRYLARYPSQETQSAAETERAEKLRQIIDEKNAEKNYRIGLYYEKQKYIQSAIIYYEDTKARYPHTKWGEKATSRLQALESPADFHTKRTKEVEAKLQALETQLQSLGEDEKDERDELKDKMDRLKKKEKTFEKEKKDTFKNREDDIKRREGELKEKFKKLEKKRKLAEGKPSADFQRAMDRWHASLVREQESLAKEKEQLLGWKGQLGMDKKGFSLDPLPFFGGEEETELERVRRIEAKKLYSISEEKRELLEEKEVLYKKMGEVSTLIEDKQLADEISLLDYNADLKKQQDRVSALRAEIERTEEKFDVQEQAFKKSRGDSFISQTVSFLNPFDSKGKDLKGSSQEELSEKRMHVREKVASQQNLVDTLTEAFDAELALKEQKRLMKQIEHKDEIDPNELRKSMKALEKDIRGRYQEIQDRHERKKTLLKELEGLSNESDKSDNVLTKTGRVAAAPAKLVHAFLFGMPSEREKMEESVTKIDDGRANQLQEEIELESLMIEANSQEIINLERELEILKAQASLAGGLKFRSAFVDVPYQFIEGAITSAKNMIPRKARDEMLIQKLEEETGKLEAFRAELAQIDAEIQKRRPEAAKKEEVQKATDAEFTDIAKEIESLSELAQEPVSAPKAEGAEVKLDALNQDLKAQKSQYEVEKQKLKEEIKKAKELKTVSDKDAKEQKKQMKAFEKQQEALQKDLGKIRKQISELITKESELETKETDILEKRITHIDRVMAKVKSRAISQDLLTEKDRMEERLSQIELRRDFLTKEGERFQFQEAAAAR